MVALLHGNDKYTIDNIKFQNRSKSIVNCSTQRIQSLIFLYQILKEQASDIHFIVFILHGSKPVRSGHAT